MIVLRVSTGLGYLQGADWGGDVSASGKINGMQTDVSAFFTAGPMGFQSRSGRVSIFAPDGQMARRGGRPLFGSSRAGSRGACVLERRTEVDAVGFPVPAWSRRRVERGQRSSRIATGFSCCRACGWAAR